jgi:shikimate 5-dehydrogenase
MDANYTPWETLFLKQMAEQGFKTLNGFSHMLAGTTLHLFHISKKEVGYAEIKKIHH